MQALQDGGRSRDEHVIPHSESFRTGPHGKRIAVEIVAQLAPRYKNKSGGPRLLVRRSLRRFDDDLSDLPTPS